MFCLIYCIYFQFNKIRALSNPFPQPCTHSLQTFHILFSTSFLLFVGLHFELSIFQCCRFTRPFICLTILVTVLTCTFLSSPLLNIINIVFYFTTNTLNIFIFVVFSFVICPHCAMFSSITHSASRITSKMLP